MLKEQQIEWRRRDEYLTHIALHGSDDEVEKEMYGHAIWDDPPEGFARRELLIWSRGYLYGQGVVYGNCAEYLYYLEEEEDLC